MVISLPGISSSSRYAIVSSRPTSKTTGVAVGVDVIVEVGEGVVGAVAAQGEAEILDDPYADPRFDPRVDQLTGFQTRSLLTVPVRDGEGSLIAVLQLLNHRGGGFSEADVEFLEELGVPFAIALTTADLHREIVAREQLRREVRLAAEIQRALQPEDRDDVQGLDIDDLFEILAHWGSCP